MKEYWVKWSLPFSSATDFVFPGQGDGKAFFDSVHEAIEFKKILIEKGIKTGPHDGQKILGFELKIETNA